MSPSHPSAKLEKLAALATLKREEENDLARQNEAAAAARAFFRAVRDGGIKLRFENPEYFTVPLDPVPSEPIPPKSYRNNPVRTYASVADLRDFDSFIDAFSKAAGMPKHRRHERAREDGQCWRCKKPFRRGDPVYYPDGKAPTHADCGSL